MLRFGVTAALVGLAGSSDAQELDPTLQRLELGGDFRAREEIDTNRQDAEGNSLPLRQRPRIRGRVAASFFVLDELEAAFRVVTGDPDNPRSSHQTLEGAGQKFPISLDRAFLGWEPAGDLVVRAGKIPIPEQPSTVYGEPLWDGDVNLPGVSVAVADGIGGDAELFASAGEFLLIEQSNGTDIHSTVAQIGLDYHLGLDWYLRLMIDATRHWNPTANGATLLLDLNRGNATVDEDGDGEVDAFQSEFRILQSTVEVYRAPWVLLSGGWIYNLGAVDEADGVGWFAGASTGQTSEPGQVRVYAQYQHVGNESVFSPFSQDDFLHATGYRGVVGGLAFVPFDRASIHFYNLASQRLQPARSSWEFRTRLDFNVAF